MNWNLETKVQKILFNASVKSLCEEFLILGCWRRRKPISKAYYDSCIIYHPTLQQQGWTRPSFWVLVTPWPCKHACTSQSHPSTIIMGFLENSCVIFLSANNFFKLPNLTAMPTALNMNKEGQPCHACCLCLTKHTHTPSKACNKSTPAFMDSFLLHHKG